MKDFIETGTYYGDTATWAAHHFENVITCEYSKEIYEKTLARHSSKQNNIKFIWGDSRSVLKAIVPKLIRPAIFWLDSHWSGGKTYGRTDECPLIEEIHAINTSECTHFLFIDDARLFTSPPPRPHQMELWPSIDEVIEALKSATHTYYIIIIEDVIIAVPQYAEEVVAVYSQEVNTRMWEKYEGRLDGSGIKRGFSLIGRGVRLIGGGLYCQLKDLARSFVGNVMPK